MSETDRKIGQNLARLRGDRSQQFVADAMRDLGWKWSQATVWSIEKGERPLRLAEAGDLTRVLDGFGGVHALLENEHQGHARAAGERAVRAMTTARTALFAVRAEQMTLEEMLESDLVDWDQVDPDTREWVQHLAQRPLTDIADQVAERWSERSLSDV